MAMTAMAEAAAAAIEAEKSGQDEDEEVQRRIKGAVAARATYITDHAESLTMLEFRRMIETDLGMAMRALDPYKKTIKQLVDDIMNADDPDEVDEAIIKEALTKRSSDLKSESRNIELEQVIRMLEKDLSLEKLALDTKKELIKSLLDELVNSSDVTKEEEPFPSASEVETMETQAGTGEFEEKKRKQKSVEEPRKKKRLVKKLTETDKSDRNSSEEDDPGTATKKKSGTRKSVGKQLEESDEEDSVQKKPSKVISSQEEQSEEVSKESMSDSGDSNTKKTSKKKAAKASESKPVVSKVAEQLKRMIKTAGMNIPPTIYKRVKQVPEAKRENALIKELESILQKEELDRNSSEKDLKAVRRKKDKQKDLEGIDVGNIITEGRGRRQQANMFYDTPLPVAKKKRMAVVSDDEGSTKSEEERKQGV